MGIRKLFPGCLAILAPGLTLQAEVLQQQSAVKDIPSMIGTTFQSYTSSAEEQAQTLSLVGCRVSRGGPRAEDFWQPRSGATKQTRTIHPETMDALAVACHKYNIDLVVEIGWYANADWFDALDQYDWYQAGRKLAERFAPNSDWWLAQGVKDWGVRRYNVFNELAWMNIKNPELMTPQMFAQALKDYAAGVHSVDASLLVSLEGFVALDNPNSQCSAYFHTIAPLYKDGTLSAFHAHHYRSPTSLNQRSSGSCTKYYETIVQRENLPPSVEYHNTEINCRGFSETLDAEAAGLLTMLWDNLGLVNADGKPINQFTLVWNLFHNESGTVNNHLNHSFCKQRYPWDGNLRGDLIQMVCKLTQGMGIVSSDPEKTGMIVLKGQGKKMWIWQNRLGWSNLSGTSLRLGAIPTDAKRLSIYRYCSWRQAAGETGTPMPYRIIPLKSETRLVIEDLPPGETLMILADRDDVKSNAGSAPSALQNLHGSLNMR